MKRTTDNKKQMKLTKETLRKLTERETAFIQGGSEGADLRLAKCASSQYA
jgi:hypothetical protein